MKISTFIIILIFIGAMLFVFSSMVNESNIYYPDSPINNSSWAGKYDYSSQINSTIYPLQNTFSKIEDENTGWFTRITAGIAAIPLAVVRIPALLFTGFSLGGSLITGMFTTFGIPSALILIFLIGIIAWGIFKLLETYQRWNI